MDGKGKATVIPDLPVTRPKTIAKARDLIRQTLDEMPWDEGEQARYFKIHGVEARTPDELTEDEVRQITADMEASRMVNFKN